LKGFGLRVWGLGFRAKSLECVFYRMYFKVKVEDETLRCRV
jgi:hypothetical protein